MRPPGGAQRVCSRSVPQRGYRDIPWGVDTTAFHPVARDRAADAPLRLVLVSRLSREKHPELALTTLAALHARDNHVHLDVVGDGPRRGALQRLARGLPVTFHGHLTRAGVAERLAIADVALATCPAESLGLGALEALASGTPIVVPTQGALPELLGLGQRQPAMTAAGASASAQPAAFRFAVERLLAIPEPRRRPRPRPPLSMGDRNRPAARHPREHGNLGHAGRRHATPGRCMNLPRQLIRAIGLVQPSLPRRVTRGRDRTAFAGRHRNTSGGAAECAPTMVLAPHPDDETIGCGGTIARLTATGTQVTVVLVTDGEATIGSPHHRATTALLRRAEASAACAALGAEPPIALGLAHGHVASTPCHWPAPWPACPPRSTHSCCSHPGCSSVIPTTAPSQQRSPASRVPACRLGLRSPYPDPIA